MVCNTHLCDDCNKQRKHMMHKTKNILEIEASNEELNIFLKLINEYINKISNSQIENNILVDLKNKYN